MLKKVLASLTLVLLLSGSGLAAEPIRIGYLVALTGDNAPFGITEANMARMIVDEQNEAGGLLGGRPIELIVYDTKTRNEDAVNAARRMIESDRVCVIIGDLASGINIATAPIVNPLARRNSLIRVMCFTSSPVLIIPVFIVY